MWWFTILLTDLQVKILDYGMLFKIFERDSQPSFSHGPCGVLLVMVADMKSSKKGELQQISCFQGECNVSLPDSDTR